MTTVKLEELSLGDYCIVNDRVFEVITDTDTYSNRRIRDVETGECFVFNMSKVVETAEKTEGDLYKDAVNQEVAMSENDVPVEPVETVNDVDEPDDATQD